MVISERVAERALANALDGSDPGSTLRDHAFSAGADEGGTIAADQVAEVATIEVGADGSGNLTDALAVMVGAPADKFKDAADAKPEVDLQNSTPADVPDGTFWFFGKRSRQSRGGPEITGMKDEDNYSAVAVEHRSDLTPKNPAVKEAEVLALYAYNPTQSFEVVLANSSFSLPVIIGTDA